MLQQIVFIIVAALGLGLAGKQFMKVRRNILLAQDEEIRGDTAERWRHVLLVAFGQQKMFKRWIPALFHFFIYAAFLITQVELIEIFIDGIFGQHRFFAGRLGAFYTFSIGFIEVLSFLAFIATIIFLIRRNALRIPRLQHVDLKGWPKLDANLILIFEIILLIGIFSMNGADVVLQDRGAQGFEDTGTLAISSWLGPALFGNLSNEALLVVERFGWWLHLLMVFVFLNYLPKSKHLHILLAFPNTYFARTRPKGEMENMPAIMNEVKSMMGLGDTTDAEEMSMEEELPDFGANDVFSLSWVDVLGAYTCTECGRCTAVCPANITGKKLSPRKIMMDIRDRTEEISRQLDQDNRAVAKDPEQPLSKDNYDDQRSLFDYISREEIYACTTCNACVEACPVLINPLEPILKMRRYDILTLSAGPGEWLPMFNSIENQGAAWAMNIDREQWVREANEENDQ